MTSSIVKMVNSTSQLAFLAGVLSWPLIWILSASLNFKFGMAVGGGLAGMGLIFALFFFCLDLAKGAAQVVLKMLEDKFGRQWWLWLLRLFIVGALLMSLYIAASFNFAAREYGRAVNTHSLDTKKYQKGEIDDLLLEKKNLKSPRTIAVLEVEIARMERNERWGEKYSDKCTNDTIAASKLFCDKYKNLQTELLSRKRLNEINQKLPALMAKRESNGPVSDVDPMATFLAKYFAGSGGNASAAASSLMFALSLIAATLGELWSAFGLSWILSSMGRGSLLQKQLAIAAKDEERSLQGAAKKNEPSKPLALPSKEIPAIEQKQATPIARFVAENYEPKSPSELTQSDFLEAIQPEEEMFERYKNWSAASHLQPIGQQDFSAELTKLGYVKEKIDNQQKVLGLKKR